MSEDLLFETSEGVATVTFNRPYVLNAITFEMYERLRALFEELREDRATKVVVITGRGKAFCSGGDLHKIIGELLARDMAEHLKFARLTGEVVRQMRTLDKPIIAAVNGMCAGAGAVIALASDLRLASVDARFAFLFTKVGLTGADMGAAYLLPRVVGAGRAAELLMFGDAIDAATAERYGLVNRVTAPEDLIRTAREWAARLAEAPALALSMTKRMLENESNMDLHSALEAEAQAQALLLMGEDHRRFYEAFKEKRKPVFIGK